MIWLTKNKEEEQNMFSENLKTIRKEKGFSQEQLAARLNVVRQTISKWEKGLSVPDAEMLIQLADVLEVEVSDLLGKKVEITEGQNELDALALELAKLNELLVVYGNKASDLKKKVGILIAVILIVVFVCAIFGTWTDMWHEFGQNLYYMLND
jgi:putative transcriptional regulator